MARKRDERVIGTTRMYDATRDEHLQNSLDLRLEGDRAVMAVGGADAKPGRTRVSDHPEVGRMLRGALQDMRRESYRARRITPRFKTPGRRAPEKAGCPQCEGRRFLEDPATGEEWPCPTCNGG